MMKKLPNNLSHTYFMSLLGVSVLLLLLLAYPISSMADSVGCNDTFVQLANNEMVIDVAPNSGDDTVNIQCALDAAISTGVPVVRLQAATYSISKLMVEGFNGSFQGRTQLSTIINVLDSSINCEAMELAGQAATAFKFIGGEPRIRFMTINAHLPCTTSFQLDAIVHFSGQSALANNCKNDVIFGVVDRVSIDGTSNETGPWAGVIVQPEGSWLGGCKIVLLGTFKLNRSIISNTFAGLVTRMKGGAQVDVNFNEFRNNLQAVSLFDSNQNMTVTANKFFGDNSAVDSYFGVFGSNFSATPPSNSRLVVNNNEFNIASTFTDNWSYGVIVRFNNSGGDNPISNISSVVTNNRFILNGTKIYAVRFRDTSNGHVSANRFSGSGARAIYISGDTPVSGWTITSNLNLAAFVSNLTESIRLANNTSECIVGGSQGALVQNDGTNNTVLPQ